MKQINVAVIGTGWCGGIRAVASAASPWVKELHIAEIREDRLKEVAEQTRPVTATTDYRRLIENPSIDAVMISTTPEPTHFPIAKEAMLAGKHVFLEKPIALELSEANYSKQYVARIYSSCRTDSVNEDECANDLNQIFIF